MKQAEKIFRMNMFDFYVAYSKAQANEIYQPCLYHRHPANDKI